MTCRFRILVFAILMPLTLSVTRADVTLRYKMEVKANPGLSAQMAAGAMSQESVLRLKGGKGFSSSVGFNSIVDFAAKEVTILDTTTKRFAKMTSDQFGEEMVRAMPEISAQARASLATMKADVSPARVTGGTAVIQGVEAEEREIGISIEGPAMPGVPSGPMVRMVVHIWSAKPGEVARVPAIRELTGYSLWSFATMNPAAGMGKMMTQIPGFPGMSEALMKEMQKAPTVLRMHMDMFMPSMAAMLRQLPAESNPLGAGFDSDAPFMQMNQELVEISAETVPDSVFRIPDGYREAPAVDLVKGMFAKSQAAAYGAGSKRPSGKR
jgi:hypothetical protein